MVAVQQADGLYEIEKGDNMGKESDFYVRGNSLGPGGFPGTDSYQDGNVRRTGIKITALTDPGFIMLFQVEGLSGARAPRAFWDAGDDDDDDAVTGSDGPKNPPLRPLPHQQANTDTTGGRITWILSILAGTSLMVGLLMVLM